MSIKSTSTRFLLIILSFAVLMQLGCKKNDDLSDNPAPVLEPPVKTDDAVKVTASVTGSVIDENNQPVTNAVVTADTYTATTDAMGNFVLSNINISKANGHVTVIKQGYFKGIRSFVTEAGKNNYVKIQLIKQVVSGTVTAATGGVINTLTGASINFPANAFVTAGGTPYTGTVFVYAHWIDPTAANLPLVVPGDLRGIDSANGEYILKSYGMVGAELQDNSGNTLKLAPGKTATVSFPIPASLQSTAPATIPLWHFDETAARWKQEGTATKNGNFYTGQVNKFSFWNVDVPGNFITLDLRLINSANNLPLTNTLVKVTSLVTNTSAYDFTNDSGFVSGYVPKNENLKLEVIAGTSCNTSTIIHTQNIGPYTANTSLGNISVTVPVNLLINFTGTVKNCNNQPVTNGYISLRLANGASTIAFTDAAGNVNFGLPHCGGSQTYSFNAVDLATGNYSTTVTAAASGNNISLGTVTACGNSINTSGVYIAGYIDNNAVIWKDGTPTFLTNISTSSFYHYAYAVKVIVSNNDVYAVGVEEDSALNGMVGIIKLWKNGIAVNLTNGTTAAHAESIDVYNGDTYVCGYEGNAGSGQTGKVWKNGIAATLPKDTFDYITPSTIKVVNGDVYVSGTATKFLQNAVVDRAVYWKNNLLYTLPVIHPHTDGTGLFVSNGDVYVSGTENDYAQYQRAVYWKNNVETVLPLTGAATVSSGGLIFVDNSDVYVAGTVQTFSQQLYQYNGVYWKNNSIFPVTNFTGFTTSANLYDIFVKNGNSYTVGESYPASGGYTSALYFQNNIQIPLSGYSNTQNASAYGIFVQ
jgi:hypothetical protein